MRKLAFALLVLALTVGAVACEDTAKKEEEQANQPTATVAPEPTDIPMPDVDGEPTVTTSGLQIIDIDEGDGQAVVATDSVSVNYTGWLEDGTVFDGTALHNPPEPSEFSLSGVIPGWTEGLQGMKVGGKRRLIIPPDLAYGDQGSGSAVPPNATLIFDIELVSIS